MREDGHKSANGRPLAGIDGPAFVQHVHDGRGDAASYYRIRAAAADNALNSNGVCHTSHEQAAAKQLPRHHREVKHVRFVSEHAARAVLVGPGDTSEREKRRLPR